MKGKDLATTYKTLLAKYDINTPIRLAYFFGQLHHESGNFKLQRESLNYSVSGLLTTFSLSRISEVDANKYGNTHRRISNRIRNHIKQVSIVTSRAYFSNVGPPHFGRYIFNIAVS